MSEQIPLSFEKPKIVDPKVADLVEFLRGKGWMTAAQIAAQTAWDDRRVLDLASQSDSVISYPGSPGYKLLCDCWLSEYEHYRLARRHQAREMIGKVIRTDRIFYRRPAMTL